MCPSLMVSGHLCRRVFGYRAWCNGNRLRRGIPAKPLQHSSWLLHSIPSIQVYKRTCLTESPTKEGDGQSSLSCLSALLKEDFSLLLSALGKKDFGFCALIQGRKKVIPQEADALSRVRLRVFWISIIRCLYVGFLWSVGELTLSSLPNNFVTYL